MLVPSDPAELPGCREAAEVRRGFEDRDSVPLLSQSVREGQPEEAAADDGPVLLTGVRVDRQHLHGEAVTPQR